VADDWNIYAERERHRSRNVWVAVVLVVLVIGGAFAFGASRRSVPGAASTTTVAVPKVRTIHGSVTLTGTILRLDATSCVGRGGFDDIRAGAAVLVKDQAGVVIGSGSLDSGSVVASSVVPGFSNCVFAFSVGGVRDADFYQVMVSHRGGPTYSKSEMVLRDWTVEASLG